MLANYDSSVEYDTDLEATFFESLETLKSLPLIDSEHFLHTAQKETKILAEGAQGSLLDIDFGTYPCYFFYYHSCRCAVLVCSQRCRRCIWYFKAYTTRVGSGLSLPNCLTKLVKPWDVWGMNLEQPRKSKTLRLDWSRSTQICYSRDGNSIDDDERRCPFRLPHH